ncbi:MAG TPA: UDP-3-O-acyl-N-acetylglucosamine deacetylase [Rhizomicrobium sp.]|jgi:UDP-3-O-[3-hydroxymyristoyl] N-acetylglucosamine deacetylase
MPRRTIAREVTAEGIALHAGSTIRITLAPAASGGGVVFRRSDLGGREIPARYDRVAETRLGTVIDDALGGRVGVIEHLMSAVAGAGIDDLLVTLDGPEPPILAGDALSYLELLDRAGMREQDGEQPIIEILKPVTVEHGGASAALLPAEAYAFDFEIAFSSAAIGTQRMEWNFSLEGFRRDIAPARTFGFVHELDALNRAGLGRGASLLNTLAIDGDRIVNANLLRFPDEFVRHKILDAIGDMALAGAPIVGRFVGRRSGHALNNQLLRALFSNTANYRLVT